MKEQVYNCGTIEVSTALHTGRKTTAGVFAVNAENNDFHYYLRDFSHDELAELDEATFSSLRITLCTWMDNLKKSSNTSIETLAAPRGGLIQLNPRGSFLISNQNPNWLKEVVTEYLGAAHSLT